MTAPNAFAQLQPVLQKLVVQRLRAAQAQSLARSYEKLWYASALLAKSGAATAGVAGMAAEAVLSSGLHAEAACTEDVTLAFDLAIECLLDGDASGA